jgi:hypothetical protein
MGTVRRFDAGFDVFCWIPSGSTLFRVFRSFVRVVAPSYVTCPIVSVLQEI